MVCCRHGHKAVAGHFHSAGHANSGAVAAPRGIALLCSLHAHDRGASAEVVPTGVRDPAGAPHPVARRTVLQAQALSRCEPCSWAKMDLICSRKWFTSIPRIVSRHLTLCSTSFSLVVQGQLLLSACRDPRRELMRLSSCPRGTLQRLRQRRRSIKPAMVRLLLGHGQCALNIK